MSVRWFVFVALILNVPVTFAYERRPFIIAVAGGSASGKTYNAKLLVEALGSKRAELVSADNYFAPERQPREFYRDGGINYDHPSAVDMKTLALHLSYLRSGFPVQVREYTYGRKVDVPTLIVHRPTDFIVVEGIFVLHPEIARLVDYRIFVDVDRDTRLARRVHRDGVERGFGPDEVTEYFNRVVEPMHQEFVQPSALNADFILRSGDGPAEVARITGIVEEQARQLRAVKGAVMRDTYARGLRQAQASRPDQFAIRAIADLRPSQSSLGFLALSNKSDLIDTIVRESALNPARASDLTNYLVENPVPLIEVNGQSVATDHHHLIVALQNKGVGEVLTTPTDPATVDPQRLEWIRRQTEPLKFADLRNDPLRSLASMIRDLGYVRKTGLPHEEFMWADYYRDRLAADHGLTVTEEMLLNVDERQRVLDLAIAMARDPRAHELGLPGFTGGCPAALGEGASHPAP